MASPPSHAIQSSNVNIGDRQALSAAPLRSITTSSWPSPALRMAARRRPSGAHATVMTPVAIGAGRSAIRSVGAMRSARRPSPSSIQATHSPSALPFSSVRCEPAPRSTAVPAPSSSTRRHSYAMRVK